MTIDLNKIDLNKKYNPNSVYGRKMIEAQEQARALRAETASSKETDAEIAARIEERFDILDYMTTEAIEGNVRALVISGPAGLGKSFSVETALQEWDPEETKHTIVKGFAKATGLYKVLYENREAGKVVVFDDCDSLFFDETALNMLKAVCDTTERRKVSYLSEAVLRNEEGDQIPNSFEFEATMIFITNLDFDAIIDQGKKLAPHLAAMVSRSHYVDLAMKNRRDYLVRIKQVIEQGLLNSKGLTEQQLQDVCDFIDTHSTILRELSLRVALKIADVRRGDRKNWEAIAKVTCCKNAA